MRVSNVVTYGTDLLFSYPAKNISAVSFNIRHTLRVQIVESDGEGYAGWRADRDQLRGNW